MPTSYIYVVGLSTTTVQLHDIGMDVPHQKLVAIPDEKYLTSKDLHLAINQKAVFRVLAPPQQLPVSQRLSASEEGPSPRELELEAEVLRLTQALELKEQANRDLSFKLEQAERKLSEKADTHQDVKAILTMLSEQRHVFQPNPGVYGSTPGHYRPNAAESRGSERETEPVFVPDLPAVETESHVQISSQTQESDLSSARAKLKAKRQGQEPPPE